MPGDYIIVFIFDIHDTYREQRIFPVSENRAIVQCLTGVKNGGRNEGKRKYATACIAVICRRMEKLGNLYQAADRVETVYHLYSDNQDRPQELVSEPGREPVSGQEPGSVSGQEPGSVSARSRSLLFVFPPPPPAPRQRHFAG